VQRRDRPRGAAAAGPAVSPAVTLSTPELTKGLTRLVPLQLPQLAVGLIGPGGGTLRLPAAGLTLRVPAGAVRALTLFSVTAVPGSMIAYDFQPHGARFAVPLKLEQDLRASAWVKDPAMTPRVGYFADPGLLNLLLNTAQVSEWQSTVVDRGAGRLVADVHHFSGYMVSSGRTSR